METKVIVQQRVLQDRTTGLSCNSLQRSTSDAEYLITPLEATGDPAEWLAQMSVRQSNGLERVLLRTESKSLIEITRQALEANKQPSETVKP